AFVATRLLHAGTVLCTRGGVFPVAGARAQAPGTKRRSQMSRLGIPAVLLAILVSLPAGAVSAPVVNAPAGKVSGAAAGRVHVFKGIPYAQPPVGAMRWKAP